jgi:interferon-stimulated exonuclease-like 2
MVGTRHGGSALAQCTILSYDGRALFHAYIRPSCLIVDYRTRWSGILPQHMKQAVPHAIAVAAIQRILSRKILIGHDLTHDLTAVETAHPKSDIRDTAYFKPLRSLAGLVTNQNPSLKKLALRLLGRKIQTGCHDSLEDARAALDLYRKHEGIWESYLVEQNWDRAVWLQDRFWPQEIVTQ